MLRLDGGDGEAVASAEDEHPALVRAYVDDYLREEVAAEGQGQRQPDATAVSRQGMPV